MAEVVSVEVVHCVETPSGSAAKVPVGNSDTGVDDVGVSSPTRSRVIDVAGGSPSPGGDTSETPGSAVLGGKCHGVHDLVLFHEQDLCLCQNAHNI
jgi:hypothetical protein